ncbi:MAG: aspartate kinase [Bacteroidota bacterium]
MIVHKFGGAAVKDANGVINLSEILKDRQEHKVVVVSAFGKTTNNLEKLTYYIYNRNEEKFKEKLKTIRDYHYNIMYGLFSENNDIFITIDQIFKLLESSFRVDYQSYDYLYDQVVSLGEIISTKVVHAYLEQKGMPYDWMDIREFLKTDETYREANVDWSKSEKLINEGFDYSVKSIVTQGFIAGSKKGNSTTTTLGREGSDYTAAILGNILNSEQVITWKDVPGILNADPRYFDNAEKLKEISYQEAIELTYYGAKIIHPKTIKPLIIKDIPLYVKSFLYPGSEGTLISQFASFDEGIPVFIMKEMQMLISVQPRDFSFIFEEQLSKIYQKFAEHRVKVNLMQNSAITFTVSVDTENPRISELLEDLRNDFKVLYNKGLALITIRHYTEQAVNDLLNNRKVLIEQRSRHTAQFIIEDQK